MVNFNKRCGCFLRDKTLDETEFPHISIMYFSRNDSWMYDVKETILKFYLLLKNNRPSYNVINDNLIF